MSKSKSVDVLAAPEIQRHTERILALREEERQTRQKLGSIIAAIGAELVVVKEEFAADALRIMGQLSAQLAVIRSRKGSLTGESKQRVLDEIEGLRRIVLKWPAWAKPAAAKRQP